MKPETILTRYAKPVADISGAETDAQTLTDFIDQLGDASRHAEMARINGYADLETAAQYLTDAEHADGINREVLLRRAGAYLRYVHDMADEHRLTS